MSKDTHKSKFELIRNNKIVGAVTPNFDNKDDDFNFSSTSSIFEFPTANFESTNPMMNKLFMSFSNSDLIKISVANRIEDNYSTIFQGEFYGKKINSEKDSNKITLDIKAIHSFYRLAMLNLTSLQRYKEIKFSDFVYQLVSLASIPSEIHIGETLGKSIITGLSKHTNAFRLFKEVCIFKGAIATFKTDNSVEIEYKKDKISEIYNKPIPTITDKDIISSEVRSQI